MKQHLYLSILGGALGCMNCTAQSSKPNIVLIITDQQRADLCGREGFPLPVTPFADSLARQNVWFNRAYTSTPSSAPARCSLLTGRFPSATHVRTNYNMKDAFYSQDLVDILKNNGYKTALIGKNHTYLKPDEAFDYHIGYGHRGKDKPKTKEEKSFASFLNTQVPGQYLEPSPFPLEQQQPYQIVSEALEWIQDQGDSSFFVCVSIPEPHSPTQVCEPYYSMFPPEKLPPLRTDRKDLEKKSEKYQILAELEDKACPNLQRDIPRLNSIYLGMVRLIDDQMKRLVDGMKASGQYDNTLFVILTDHGDYCGEYGLIRKGAGVAESLTRIPMVWAGRGIEPQKQVMDAHVSIVDVFPTLCSATGSDIPLGVQGRSLWPMLTGEEYPRKEFSSIVVEQGYGGEDFTREDPLTFQEAGCYRPDVEAGFDGLNCWTQSGSMRMVRKGDWKLVMDNNGGGELYNLKEDPAEVTNLFDNKKNIAEQVDLLKELLAWNIRLQDPLPVPRSQYPFKRNPYNYHRTDN